LLSEGGRASPPLNDYESLAPDRGRAQGCTAVFNMNLELHGLAAMLGHDLLAALLQALTEQVKV